MDGRMDVGFVKDEEGIYYSVCEKEESDFVCDTNEFEQLNQFKNKVPVDVSCEKLYDIDKQFKDEVYSESSMETKFTVKEDDDSTELKIKQEPFDDCTYFIDSAGLVSLSETHLIGIKKSDDVPGEPFIGLDNLLQECATDSPLFYCEYCDFSTKFIGNLSRHIKRKHMPSVRKWKFFCDLCDYKCLLPGDLRRHSARHTGKYIYKCYFCDYGNNKKCGVHKHILSKHIYNSLDGFFTKSKKCYFCDFKTKDKTVLLSHILDNHKLNLSSGKSKKNINKNYYPCRLCSYVTTDKSTLIVHIDGFHKKIRPYTCNLCDYAANRPTDLRIHINAKHKKITPFKCEICGYASAYKKHLRRHVLSQHVLIRPGKKYKRRRQARYIKTEVIDDDSEFVL